MKAEHVILVGGVPACGKSSVMELVAGSFGERRRFKDYTLEGYTFPDCEGIELWGLYEPEFRRTGTDALEKAMLKSAKPRALRCGNVVIAEGDKVVTASFLNFLLVKKIPFTLFGLKCRVDVLNDRLKARKPQQNRKWVRGRAAKWRNLRAKFDVVLLENSLNSDLWRNAGVITEAINEVRK